MTNGVVNGTKVPGVSLSEEQQIRELLPLRIKTYILDMMNFPVPWSWAWKAYQEMGEDKLLAKLHLANVTDHGNQHGRDFYRFMSPHRVGVRPEPGRGWGG